MLGVTAPAGRDHQVRPARRLDQPGPPLVARTSSTTLGNPIVRAAAGTNGVTLKILTTDFAVPIPELVEAILPAQATSRNQPASTVARRPDLTLAARRARRTSGPAPVRLCGASGPDHPATNETNRTH